jgi:hypothetical protein
METQDIAVTRTDGDKRQVGTGRVDGMKEMNHKPTIDIPIATTTTTMGERWKCAAKGGRHPKGMSEPVSLRRYHYHTRLRSSLSIATTTAGAAVVVLLLVVSLVLWCLILLFLLRAKLEFVLVHVQRRSACPSTRARS